MKTDESLKERRFLLASKSRTFKNILKAFNLGEKKVVDLGCSYGEYTVHFGKGSVGITANPKEVDVGIKRGLDIRLGNVEEIGSLHLPQDFQFIWANNLFEHLLSPHAFLMNLKKMANKDCVLILGVPVFPLPHILTRLRKFSGAYSDAHINFFTLKTLKQTVESAGWKVLDARPFVWRMKALDRLIASPMPHIYVVAKNDDSFTYSQGKIQEWIGLRYYEDLLSITGQNK